MSSLRQRLLVLAPWLVLALLTAWFLGQAHVRVQGELDRMVEESWAGNKATSNPTLGEDPVSEKLTFAAARLFHARGMSETSFLPCYEGYVSESPISSSRPGDCVYTHFLAGPEYVLVALFKVFGDSDDALMRMRLLPLLLVLAAALALVLAARRYALNGWTWGAALLLAGLLTTPALSFWSLSLYGHGYSNACILAALALGLAASDPPVAGPRRWLLMVAAFLLGVLSNLFLLEAAFVVFAAPLVGCLVAGGKGSRRFVFLLTSLVAVGLCVVWLVHLAQVAHHLGSLSLAFEDQIGTALLRAESRGDAGRLEMLVDLNEAAAVMFPVGALFMLASGLFASWLHRSESRMRRRGVGALLLAGLACCLFPMAFNQHAVLHMFRLPRIFLLLYAASLLIWLCLAEERLRSDRTGQAKAVVGSD